MMPFESFNLFAEQVISMPAKDIVDVLDLSCKLLDDDLYTHRSAFAKDEYSILCFRQFIRLARSGGAVYPKRCLPPEHLDLYRHTIVRLIHVDELPQTAIEAFDKAFAAQFSLPVGCRRRRRTGGIRSRSLNLDQ
ncbi:MAG TPA: hypothetical protein VGV18_08635 [Verrucomicrobiae bacterium]|nr:hypothetical protein [Verrucomicrobiae bacterium]